MEMTYGYDIFSTEDPYIKQTMDLTDVVVQMGNSPLYDSIPFGASLFNSLHTII